MNSEVIRTVGLTRKFGDLTAVDQVNLVVKKGELFGLLGPNGAGKTTLLKLLTGQLEPSAGHSTVLGIDPSKDPVKVKSKIGIVPELESPPSFLTPREYLHYIGLIRNIEDIEKRAEHWIDFLGLKDVEGTIGKDLSKGTKQKLQLAAAFIHQPAILFLDEPFMGLDPLYQERVKKHLFDYLKNGGTIFMCTHILEIAEKMCSRIAIINRARIEIVGSAGELKQENENLAAAFLRHTTGT